MSNGNSYITESDIKEYKALHKARTGNDIDDTHAREQLSKLVRMMEIVYQPITKKQAKAVADSDIKKAKP